MTLETAFHGLGLTLGEQASESTHFNIAGATALSKLVADALKTGTTPTTSIGQFLK